MIEKFLTISIAVLALCATLWQGYESREHNRLSVRPYFLVAPKLEGTGGGNGIYVSNDGLGPGIVEDASISVNNIEYDLTRNPWKKIMEPLGLHDLCFAASWLPVGSAIKASEEVPILTVTKADLAWCYVEALQFLTNNTVEVKIQYESMYGNESYFMEGAVHVSEEDFNFSQLFNLDIGKQ